MRHIAVRTSLSNLVGAALPLLLILLAKAHGASEAQIGLVFSAGGVGGLLAAFSGGWIARRLTFGQVIIGALVVDATMPPLLWLAPGPWVLGSGRWTLGAVYAVFYFVGPAYNVVQLSRRLAMIPDGLQGRINSAFRFATTLLYPLGAWRCGVLAEFAGTGVAVAVFTTLMVLVASAAARNPLIRREGLAPP